VTLRPAGIGKFQFVILASLRAAQLMRGCLPRIEGAHKNTVMAQLEVSEGKVVQEFVPAHEPPVAVEIA
jgi:DNA-directed RNA polymerase subunit K/omega